MTDHPSVESRQAPRNCWWRHRWSKWDEIKLEKVTGSRQETPDLPGSPWIETAFYVVSTQRRECKDCGFRQYRVQKVRQV